MGAVRTAIILGAGFSRAASGLPLTDELGNEMRRRLPRVLSRAVRPFRQGSFEMWLSRIAEPQPDLTDEDNADNAATFAGATRALQEILVESELRAMSTPISPWLHQFVHTLHALQADVITFNYDTLLERAAVSSGCRDFESGELTVNAESMFRDVPGTLTVAGMWGIPHLQTFRLMKLHGSLDCYWVRGDASGATIGRLPGSLRWDPDSPSDAGHERRAPGREPFIVPPASAKSGFYNNPISRQLWRDAAEALRSAEIVAVIGYSLPATDLVTAGMIGDALGGRSVPIHVVNPDADPVKEGLSRLGVDAHSIMIHSGRDCVARFSDFLAQKQSSFELGKVRAFRPYLRMIVQAEAGWVWPVEQVDPSRTAAGVTLRVRNKVRLDWGGADHTQCPEAISVEQMPAAAAVAAGGLSISGPDGQLTPVVASYEAANWAVLTSGTPLQEGDS